MLFIKGSCCNKSLRVQISNYSVYQRGTFPVFRRFVVLMVSTVVLRVTRVTRLRVLVFTSLISCLGPRNNPPICLATQKWRLSWLSRNYATVRLIRPVASLTMDMDAVLLRTYAVFMCFSLCESLKSWSHHLWCFSTICYTSSAQLRLWDIKSG